MKPEETILCFRRQPVFAQLLDDCQGPIPEPYGSEIAVALDRGPIRKWLIVNGKMKSKDRVGWKSP